MTKRERNYLKKRKAKGAVALVSTKMYVGYIATGKMKIADLPKLGS